MYANLKACLQMQRQSMRTWGLGKSRGLSGGLTTSIFEGRYTTKIRYNFTPFPIIKRMNTNGPFRQTLV